MYFHSTSNCTISQIELVLFYIYPDQPETEFFLTNLSFAPMLMNLITEIFANNKLLLNFKIDVIFNKSTIKCGFLNTIHIMTLAEFISIRILAIFGKIQLKLFEELN